MRYFLPFVALLCVLAPVRATGCVTGAFYAPQVVAPIVIQPAQVVAPLVATQAVEAYSAPVLAVQNHYSAPVVAAFSGGYGHGVSAFSAPVVVRQRVFAVRGFQGGFGGLAVVGGHRNVFAVRGRGLGLFRGRAPAIVIRGRR